MLNLCVCVFECVYAYMHVCVCVFMHFQKQTAPKQYL